MARALAAPLIRAPVPTLGLAIMLALAGCADPEPDTAQTTRAEPGLPAALPGQHAPEPLTPVAQAPWLRAWFDFCLGHTVALRETAAQLNGAARQLAAEPSAAQLRTTRQAWHTTLASWGRLAPCVNTPLTDELAAEQRRLLRETAAGPAFPGYIDTLPRYPESGLVFDQTVDTTRAALRQQHQLTDPGEVSLGLYAVEIILFGVAASRPLSDFAADTLADRRHAIMGVQTAHLADVSAAWGAYLTRAETGSAPAQRIHQNVSHSLDQVIQSYRDQARDRPGKALLAEHDEIFQQGVVESLTAWALLPATLEWAKQSGITQEHWAAQWQAVGPNLQGEQQATTTREDTDQADVTPQQRVQRLQATWPLVQRLTR